MKTNPRAAIAAQPIVPDDLDEVAFQALVGAWSSPAPHEVGELLATPCEGDTWVFKKDHRIRRPIPSVAGLIPWLDR